MKKKVMTAVVCRESFRYWMERVIKRVESETDAVLFLEIPVIGKNQVNIEFTEVRE